MYFPGWEQGCAPRQILENAVPKALLSQGALYFCGLLIFCQDGVDLILTDRPVVRSSFKLLVSLVFAAFQCLGRGGDSLQTPGQVSRESEIFPCGIPAKLDCCRGMGSNSNGGRIEI